MAAETELNVQSGCYKIGAVSGFHFSLSCCHLVPSLIAVNLPDLVQGWTYRSQQIDQAAQKADLFAQGVMSATDPKVLENIETVRQASA